MEKKSPSSFQNIPCISVKSFAAKGSSHLPNSDSFVPGSLSLDSSIKTNDFENLRPIKCSKTILKPIASGNLDWFCFSLIACDLTKQMLGSQEKMKIFGIWVCSEKHICSRLRLSQFMSLGWVWLWANAFHWLTSVLGFQSLNVSGQWNPGGKKEKAPWSFTVQRTKQGREGEPEIHDSSREDQNMPQHSECITSV